MLKEINSDRLAIAAKQNIREKNFWMSKLTGDLFRSIIPHDKGIAGENCYQIESIEYQFPESWCEEVIKVSNKSDTRLFMILVTGLMVLLYKYSGNTDIVIGTPIFKQETAFETETETEFVNKVLLLRNQFEEESTIKELILQVRDVILEATENYRYPLEILLEELNLKNKGHQNPLFEVAVLLENIHHKNYLNSIPFNIIFSFLREENSIVVKADYFASIYYCSTIKKSLQYFEQIMSIALQDLNININRIDFLDPRDREMLLCKFNQSQADYPDDVAIHHLFEQQVKKNPHRIVIDSKDKSISYGCLNRNANQLTGILWKRNIKKHSIVMILFERSPIMITGLLGILKTGAAYLPVDVSCPLERLRYLIRESGTDLFLSDVSIKQNNSLEVERIELTHDGLYEAKVKIPVVKVDPGDLCYVLFTSGTTGKPKGVMVEHRSLVNYIAWAKGQYVKNESRDSFAFFTSISFDLTVTSIFTPLISGNRMIIFRQGEPISLVEEVLRDSYCHIVKLTPSHLMIMEELGIQTGIKRFVVGGEELKTALAEKISEKQEREIEIYNEYGPTEATVGCMIYQYNKERDK
jgi:non-ribosomal peptide synthetase component F